MFFCHRQREDITEDLSSDDDDNKSEKAMGRKEGGGGVAMYIRSNISAKVVDKLARYTHEILHVRVKMGFTMVDLILVYNSNKAYIQSTVRDIECFLIKASKENTLILGDFNVHLPSDEKGAVAYRDMTETYNFVWLNKLPTREGAYRDSFIDHIHSNNVNFGYNIVNVPFPSLDHNLLIVRIEFPATITRSKKCSIEQCSFVSMKKQGLKRPNTSMSVPHWLYINGL